MLIAAGNEINRGTREIREIALFYLLRIPRIPRLKFFCHKNILSTFEQPAR